MEMKAGLERRDGAGGETAAVPLLGVEVRAEVVAGHARAVVRQRYRNDEPRAVEAVYVFPLPSRAIVTGFVMEIGGRRLEGEVHEREEAFAYYDEAIAAGHGAALVEQERPNVFTANVGNLLPGEETILELEYVEPLVSDEGAVRWAVPTVVAPRYVPGAPAGDRTGHGTADPTTEVPDADRVSPPLAGVAYGLAVEVVFDLGAPMIVTSPSHALQVTRDGDRSIVHLAERHVRLDRDLVLTAVPERVAEGAAPLATVVAHRHGENGVFALTLLPDLEGGQVRRAGGTDVVFLLDRSGSMGGASMPEARSAAKLCLRQLREGDRFAILAFDDRVDAFAPELVPFTQSTLQRADAWLDSVDARGGTELTAPLLAAADLAPNGAIVLLTDGQVANEDAVLTSFLARRGKGSARVYTFGIGTAVSDALLLALSDRTGGASEQIHPGEPIAAKVIAQFARATAPRIVDLRVSFRGVDVAEMAPAEPVAIVDGEPFTLFGRYAAPGRGAVEIRGTLDGAPFYLDVPFDLPSEAERPMLEKLWARARIVELSRAALTSRRAEVQKERIIALAKKHRLSSKHTSFLVVEKRTGSRRSHATPETRVVPVSPPAGWTMGATRGALASAPFAMGSIVAASPMMQRAGGAPPPRAASLGAPPPAPRAAPPMPVSFAAPRSLGGSPPGLGSPPPAAPPRPADPLRDLFERQAASGLWEEAGSRPLEATFASLARIVRLGITSADPTYGAQIKKALDAVIAAASALGGIDANRARALLGAAWLLADGRRTRRTIEQLAQTLGVNLGEERSLRSEIEKLSASP